MDGSVAQGERDVGVVVAQLGKNPRRPLEQARLGSGPLHPGSQHGDRVLAEQIAALLAGQLHRDGLSLQPAPQGAQALRRAGGVKGDREGLAQTVAGAVLAQQPGYQPAFRSGVQVEQPAGQFHGSGSGSAGRSSRRSRSAAPAAGEQVVELLAQAHDLFVLLQQHGQQEGLEGQRVGGVGRRGQVLVG